ncbi:hypothetical protein V2S23_27760, partial [Klebsiella pneumoniae]|nr:hypothetical protein [Klebsiella pneumoniae]
ARFAEREFLVFRSANFRFLVLRKVVQRGYRIARGWRGRTDLHMAGALTLPAIPRIAPIRDTALT